MAMPRVPARYTWRTARWGDPALLDRLKSAARRFTVDEGGTQTLDLKLTAKY